MHEMQQVTTVRDLSDVEMNIELAKRGTKVAENTVTQIQTLADKLLEAQQALNLACGSFKAETMLWIEEDLPSSLREVRNLRLAMGSEFSQLKKQLEELRQFFIGPTYDDELSRLKEFVELAERLRTLKDSGFLDTVADTMLRLAR